MRHQMYEKEKHIGFWIKHIDLTTRRLYEIHARELGLDEVTITNGRFLGYLYYRRGQDVFQKDLENEFRINRSSVATILKLMEKKGYIVRESMESDARLKRVMLTPLGEETHLKSMQCIQMMEEDLENALTEEEQNRLLTLLAKIEKGITQNDGKTGSLQGEK